MLSGNAITQDALESKINFYITQLGNFKTAFKQFYKKMQETPALHDQFELWQASKLRADNEQTREPTSPAPPLAADDFISWHDAVQDTTKKYLTCVEDLRNFVQVNHLLLDVDEITISATADKHYFPAYQLLFDKRIESIQKKIAELQLNKKTIMELKDAGYNTDHYYSVYNVVSFLRVSIPLLFTYGLSHASSFASLQLASTGLDLEISKAQAQMQEISRAFKQEFKNFTQHKEKADQYNARIALSQGLFKAEKYKKSCNKPETSTPHP